MRFLQRVITGLVLAAISLALVGWAGFSVTTAVREAAEAEEPNRAAREVVMTVGALEIQPVSHRPVLTVPGELRARRALEVRARSGGVVVYLAPEVEEGGRVTAGQLLVRTDPAAAEAALASAEADEREAGHELTAARRAAELAKLDLAAAERQADLQAQALARQQDLLGRGVGSASSVETTELAAAAADQAVVSRQMASAEADTRIDQASARLARARVALSEARRALSDTEIFAAFDGALSEVTVVDGGLVAANERLAVLVDPGDLEVAFWVSTAQYARLGQGGEALDQTELAVTLQSGGLTLEARAALERAAPRVGEGQTGRLLLARLQNSAGFRAGDLVQVRLREPELEGVAVLPTRAVTANGGVLRIGEDNRLVAQPVTVLRRTGDEVLIEARSLAGGQIVAAVTPLLGPGILVEPNFSGQEAPTADASAMLRLAPDRKARLIAFVQENPRLSDEARARVLAQLEAEEVPARMVARLESRMGS